MAIQYTPRMLFRQVPPGILKSYFEAYEKAAGPEDAEEAKKAIAEVDWGAITEKNVEPLYEKWLSLSKRARDAMECDFRKVAALATEEGARTLVNEGEFHKVDLKPDLQTREGLYHFAFWVLVTHRTIFTVASQLDRADHLNGRYWRTRSGMPAKDPDVTEEGKDRLAKAISAHFMKREGRGEMCKVDCYKRDKRHDYYFVYSSSYADTFVGWQNGEFKNQPQQPAFEVIFVYTKDEQRLDLFALGNRELAHELQQIFAREILATEIDLEPPPSPVFRLNKLKNRGFAFPLTGTDCVTDVRLKTLRLAIIDPERANKRARRRITLEADPSQGPDDIYDLIVKALNLEKLPLSRVNVTMATIQAKCAQEGGKTKTVTFNISFPDTCNLGDAPEHVILRNYLKAWKLFDD